MEFAAVCAWAALGTSLVTVAALLLGNTILWLVNTGRLVRFGSPEEVADYRVWRKLDMPHMGDGVGRHLHQLHVERRSAESLRDVYKRQRDESRADQQRVCALYSARLGELENERDDALAQRNAAWRHQEDLYLAKEAAEDRVAQLAQKVNAFPQSLSQIEWTYANPSEL